MLMPEDDFNSGDSVYLLAVNIQPISIQHISTHVAYSPIWPEDDGGDYSGAILTGHNSHSLACIISGIMPKDSRPSRDVILYSIEISMEIYAGLTARKDGIGVQKLALSRIVPMRNFWKPGYLIRMEVSLSPGSIQSLINVYSYRWQATQRRKQSSGL
jgi:hypothetical protein